ncbi:MAG: 50S ribosomal protein L22 [Bacteroides sp.]|nr:MAG: 50S ribosomal protein L22 [Bacteroides sp.]
MESIAKLNNCSISDRKIRLLSNVIRNKSVYIALHQLKFSNRKTSAIILKNLLMSAVTNWKIKNKEIDLKQMYIKKIFVNGGRQLKRIKPAPQGRACRIRKRTNHITIVVDSNLNVNI